MGGHQGRRGVLLLEQGRHQGHGLHVDGGTGRGAGVGGGRVGRGVLRVDGRHGGGGRDRVRGGLVWDCRPFRRRLKYMNNYILYCTIK